MVYEVSIDRLVIEGGPLGPADRDAVAAAVEAELGRLIATGGLPASLLSGGSYPHVRGRFEPPAGASAGDWGAAVAAAIYGGFSS